MFKKILSIILMISFLSIPVAAEVSFNDMDEKHWAYPNVIKLVNDGTVKGYEDGSFKPANTVTRAEFVKMIGCGPDRRDSDFEDVSKTHWAYEYIMTSGFETEGNNFYPSLPITRGETIELLWKRHGSKTGVLAPSVITEQYPQNKDAISWAYNYKVMIGDDGLNLRLNDTLSRAEAATLIIRTSETDFTKPQSDFKDIVSESTMKTVFESYNLFDDNRSYSPDATITNGEMARAALRLLEDEFNLTYSSYPVSTYFDHKYYKDLLIVFDRCIKKGVANREMADLNANIENTVAAFSFAALEKANELITYGNINNTYKDVSKDIEIKKNMFLTFAYEKGIKLKADDTIGALRDVTHKDIAALLIQYDALIGLETIFSTNRNGINQFIKYDAKLNKNIALYPSTKDKFACIVDGIDNRVYEKAIEGDNPEETYDFAREYVELFVSKVLNYASYLRTNYGIESEILVYPSLVWTSGDEFILRIECKVLYIAKDATTTQVFGDDLVIPVDEKIVSGSSYFVEVALNKTDLFFR